MSAVVSECGKYRYVLKRKIPQTVRWIHKCVFIMLNPSTADAEKDDPTIRRCIAFAKREGCTDLTVVNLFGYRATNPKELMEVEDPLGPENNAHLIKEIQGAQLVIAAWGAHKMAKCALARELKRLGILCLGTNKDGSPKHPLYVKADQPWMEFK